MNESEREGEKTNRGQIKSETRWFVLPRFGSCKPTPRWGGHKDRVSFNPFPLSNGHLDRVSFSSQSNGTQSPRNDHHTIGVSCLGYNWVDHKKEWEKEAIQAQELKWTQMSLSLVTIWFVVIPDLGEDLIYLVVPRIECYSSCNVLEGGKLGCNWIWGGWGIYSPNHQKWPLGGYLSHGAPDSPVRQPRQPAVGLWPLELWLVGPLGCPVVHRTGPVDCPVPLLRVLWLWRAL
jgi:hypothetical protein